MTPDRFDGRGPILDYLSHFEACAGVNGWSDQEALTVSGCQHARPPDADMLPVRVYNPTKEERVVKQGTMVACLTELQEADDVKSGDGVELPSHLAELFERSNQDVQSDTMHK